MKNLLYLLLILALPLSFTACGGDDDEEETWGTEINPIEGTWIKSNDEFYKIIFTKDFKDKLYLWNEASEVWELSIEREYIINKESFKYIGTNNILYYKVDKDTLYIYTDSSKEKSVIYYREK